MCCPDGKQESPWWTAAFREGSHGDVSCPGSWEPHESLGGSTEAPVQAQPVLSGTGEDLDNNDGEDTPRRFNNREQ